MNHPKLTILRIIGKKLAILALIVAGTVGAFATLGDGKSKSSSNTPRKSLLSNRKMTPTGTFSLKPEFAYRGSKV